MGITRALSELPAVHASSSVTRREREKEVHVRQVALGLTEERETTRGAVSMVELTAGVLSLFFSLR